MKDADLIKLLPVIEQIAVNAGERILDIYNSDDFEVQIKADSYNSPLTKADKISNDEITAELGEVSDYQVVSEENNVEADKTKPFWLIDPLDGTKEFVKRNGEFTVNIALIVDAKPVLGVVYAPVLSTTYSGASDKAYKIVEGKKNAIRSVANDKIPTIVTSRSHKDEITQKLLDRIGEYNEICMGSSLKLCLVAEGKAMLYPRLAPTYPWDTAAADAVVRSAGGRVTNTEGNDLDYGVDRNIKNPFFIVASKNAINWQELLSSILPKS